MPRVKVGPAPPDASTLDVEIARLRDLDVASLRPVRATCSDGSLVSACRITPARAIIASMAGHVVIRITERLGGGEPLRTAYAVAEPNQHRAVALFKLIKTGSHRRRAG